MTEKLPIKIYPSLLSADFGQMAEEAVRAVEAGADALHLDVMDGNFVPNLAIGPQIVAAVNRATDAFLDVHLMIYHPFDFVEAFVKAGADRITFHLEATEDVRDTLRFIRRCNVLAGLALRPETPVSLALPYLDDLDLILLMTVNPGFGGQQFMPEVLEKIVTLRSLCDKLERALPIQVDGGIDLRTVEEAAKAGATDFVSGSGLYSQQDLRTAITELRARAAGDNK